MKRGDIFPSKYLAASDVPDEGCVLTINHVEEEKMRDGKPKPVIYFDEAEKGMVCNVTNWKVLEQLYGDESDDWAGERIQLYVGETTFDGDVVACIRVKNRKPKVTPAKPNGAKAQKIGQKPEGAVDAVVRSLKGHQETPEDIIDPDDPAF